MLKVEAYTTGRWSWMRAGRDDASCSPLDWVINQSSRAAATCRLCEPAKTVRFYHCGKNTVGGSALLRRFHEDSVLASFL
ncbi:hypothetical protein OC71_22460 [Pseudomonas sp. W15Feb9B]|nr:hypothetical protein OC71_22460 [Pseudomonas sp. W15Feb9B]